MTDLEKEWVQKVKHTLLAKKGVDLSKRKSFGPRTASGIVNYDNGELVDGSDPWFDDEYILRFITGRKLDWDVD